MVVNVMKRRKNGKIKRNTRLLKKLYISHRNKVISDNFEEREIQKKGRAFQKEGFSSFREYFLYLKKHETELENVKEKNSKVRE